MKRSEALKPLSREHHQSLVIALRIKKAAAQSDEALINYWQEVLQQHRAPLLAHFCSEEAGFSDLLNGEIKQQFSDEHEQLRTLLNNPVNHSDILHFADLIKAHVAFEEKKLFPWLEQHHPELINTRFL